MGRRGRSEGERNLKKLEGGFLENKHGVVFTEQEKKNLVSLVNSANRKRKKMIEWESNLDMLDAGVKTGLKVGEAKPGHESDLILRPRSKSMHQFESKKEYDVYIKNLKRVTDRNYINKRVEQYKENYKKAIHKELGHYDTREIIKAVDKMNHKKFMAYIGSDDFVDIKHVYGPEDEDAKYEVLTLALGVNPKSRME